MTPVITTVAITVLSILTGLGTTETATDNERRSFICRPLHQARRDGNHTCFERHSFCWLLEHKFFCLRRSCAAYIKKVFYDACCDGGDSVDDGSSKWAYRIWLQLKNEETAQHHRLNYFSSLPYNDEHVWCSQPPESGRNPCTLLICYDIAKMLWSTRSHA